MNDETVDTIVGDIDNAEAYYYVGELENWEESLNGSRRIDQ